MCYRQYTARLTPSGFNDTDYVLLCLSEVQIRVVYNKIEKKKLLGYFLTLKIGVASVGRHLGSSKTTFLVSWITWEEERRGMQWAGFGFVSYGCYGNGEMKWSSIIKTGISGELKRRSNANFGVGVRFEANVRSFVILRVGIRVFWAIFGWTVDVSGWYPSYHLFFSILL